MSSSQSGSSQPGLTPGFGSGQFRSTQEANAFERWRSSLAHFTGMGLSDDDKAKREKLKGLELEESQWKRCEAWKTDLMRNSPVVVFMLKHLASENAKLTPAHIHCAPCDATRAGGFSPEAGILLCQDRFMSKRHMQDTLVHEMVHVYDHAKFNVDWGNLRHHACSEIRAASLSGDCRWSRETQRGFMAFSKQHQACARRRAILSVIANPACKSPEEAERAVNEVWESCFKDTRPFDEWHSLRDSNCTSIVMGSPPKPWERAGTMAALADPAPPVPSMAASTVTPSSSSDAPAVPTRPDSITPQAPITSLSPFSSNTYGSSYSPYNRFGSYGSSYGGYGGSMYGGSMYGGGMYGGGMYGGGMYGQPQYGPGMDPSLTQSVAASTQQAFGLLGNVVGTFTSFAQMLDSSFMATQSSIFAILGVADQLSQLRALVGQVAGVFGLVGWLRGWFSREKRGTMAADFKKFMKGDDGPRPSKKPFIIILLAIFGLPYVMHKLVRALSTRLPPPVEQFDMSKVQFATALFDFTTSDQMELGLKRGDLVAIVGRTEGGDWFRGRTREGKQGWFPANHVQIIKKDTVKKVDEPKTV